jgi:hypothetical protein
MGQAKYTKNKKYFGVGHQNLWMLNMPFTRRDRSQNNWIFNCSNVFYSVSLWPLVLRGGQNFNDISSENSLSDLNYFIKIIIFNDQNNQNLSMAAALRVKP